MTINRSPEFIIRLLAPALWAFIVLLLSLTSSPPRLSGFLGWDKLQHAGAYGLLSFLIMQYLCYRSSGPRKSMWYASLTAVFFGACLEIMQLLVAEGRTAEWGDLAADAAGAFLTCVIFRQFVGLNCANHELLDKNNG